MPKDPVPFMLQLLEDKKAALEDIASNAT